jgi:hypothetical protein
LEAFAKDLVRKAEPIRSQVAAAKAKLAQAAEIEAQIGEVHVLRQALDEKTAALAEVNAKTAEFEASPAAKGYQAELESIEARERLAIDERSAAIEREHQLRTPSIDVDAELRAEIRSRGYDPGNLEVDLEDIIPKERLQELRATQAAMDAERAAAKAEVKNKSAARVQAAKDAEAAKAELAAKNAETAARRGELDEAWAKANDQYLEANAAYQAKANVADPRYQEQAIADRHAEIEGLKKEAAETLGPANKLDLDYLDAAEQELVSVRQKLRDTRAEQSTAKTEFDEAYNVEQQVTQATEASTRDALDARKLQAEAKLKEARRGWQEIAAEKDPESFQQWKLEVEGTDPFKDGPNEMRPLQQEVLDLRKEEAEVEKQIGSHRDKRTDLERQIADDEAEVAVKRQEHQAARQQADASKAEVEQAEKEARAAEMQHAARQEELNRLKLQQSEAEAEIERVKSGGDPTTLDPSTPSGLDAIDAMAKRSHDLSQQVKPGWVGSIEEGVKSAAGAFGRKWEQMFNGQSPDDVAKGLKKSRDNVIRLRKELDAMTADYDDLKSRIGTLKSNLDLCIRENTHWSGDANP